MSKGKENADAKLRQQEKLLQDTRIRYQRRRRARKRRRRVRNVCIALLVIFIVVIGLAGGTIYWIKYGPTKETYDLNKYFGITAKSQMGVTINNEVLDAQAITEGGTAYLSYNLVQDYIIVFTGIPMSIYFCIHCREIW